MRPIASIRHIDIVVSSIARSLPFYQGFLSLLGWSEVQKVSGERGEPITYLAGPNGFAEGALGLREAPRTERTAPLDRYNVGLHHFAINAHTPDAVNRVASWLKANGGRIESGPDTYYGSGYYAVFFYDPDGMKLEVVSRLDGEAAPTTEESE